MKELNGINEDYIMTNESDLILEFVKEERKRCKQNADPEVLLVLDKILDDAFRAGMRNFKRLRDEGQNL